LYRFEESNFAMPTLSRSRSNQLFDQAKRLIPGGVNSAARAFGAVGGNPIFIEKADGPYLFDVDGNRYIDFIGSWGPMILGHADPDVIAAIEKSLANGTSYGAPTQAENELAELIIELVPSVEMVRLVSSGTEATLSAIRLARGFTGRDKIVKFAGNYHGHVDSLLVAAGSAAATLSIPNSPGVTRGTSKDTIVLEYNDCDMLVDCFRNHKSEIAAVIFEPICGNMGCVPATNEFMQCVREQTASDGALMIMDEVMTCFRVALNCAQSLYNVDPDITTLGKIVGGGMPMGAFGGKSEIMKHIAPSGKVFQAGTLSGNPIATAAGIATLKKLKSQNPYSKLEFLSRRLEDGFNDAIGKSGVIAHVQRVGSMLTLFFSSEKVTNWSTAATCNTQSFSRFFWQMMDNGIYLPCSQYEAMFVSTTHNEQIIDETIQAAHDALTMI
jgi:glutamate-1-semialdehyde 2,1-aminomutase